jgi:drug/metabolite transporter (DMT)-like permease
VIAGAGLSILAVAIQSVGKVLYGTFLFDMSTATFVLVSFLLTASVFLFSTRFRLPKGGLGLMAANNVFTAVAFLGMFYALKHLPPAIFASIEIGISILAAIALTSVQTKRLPPWMRLLACSGILAGGALLAGQEIAATVAEPASAAVWWAVVASILTGIASAFTALTCKQLAVAGWSSTSILAHRFYLTIAVAVLWLLHEGRGASITGDHVVPGMLIVGTLAVLLPMLLLQMALRRADALTVLICMSSQPILSFALSALSPAYGWDNLTLLGVLGVSLFIGLDILSQQKPAPAAQLTPRPLARPAGADA